MNRVAAFALLFLKEEDAFWCLVAIIDFIMPADYFSVSMVAAQADQVYLLLTYLNLVPTSHLLYIFCFCTCTKILFESQHQMFYAVGLKNCNHRYHTA